MIKGNNENGPEDSRDDELLMMTTFVGAVGFLVVDVETDEEDKADEEEDDGSLEITTGMVGVGNVGEL